MNESKGGNTWKVFGLLGKGKFSSAFLVRNTANQYYCWKSISNPLASARGKQSIILECELLKSLVYHKQQSLGTSDNSAKNGFPFIVSTYGLCEIDINSASFQIAEIDEIKDVNDRKNEGAILEMGIILSLGTCGTLSQHLRFSNISVKQSQIYASEIFQALMFLQSYPAGPIVHRDLKASNILIDSNGHVLVSDFGCAKILAHDSLNDASQGDTIARSNRRTLTMPIGTEHILAPEMVMLLDPHLDNNQKVGYDETVDLWALGVLIYEMLTHGALPPFQDIGILSAERINAAAYLFAGTTSTISERWHDTAATAQPDTKAIVGQGAGKYWDFHSVDDFWSTHFPSHLFISSYSPEKVSNMSLEKLSTLISLEEEEALKAAHFCLVNLFNTRSSERRKFIQQVLSPREFKDPSCSLWFLTDITDSVFTKPINVEKRLGCFERIEQLEDRRVVGRNNSIIDEENVFAEF